MNETGRISVVLVCPHYVPDKGGLAGHTAVLAAALAARGMQATVLTRLGPTADTFPGAHIRPTIRRWSLLGMPSLYRQTVALRPDVVLIQYVPHMYWRRGAGISVCLFALWLTITGYRVVGIVHEAYMPWLMRPERLVIGMAQRLALLVLVASCTRVAVSTSSLMRQVRRWLPIGWRKLSVVPVGSNIPLVAMSEHDRQDRRTRLSIGRDDVVLVFFGSQHEGKLFDLALRTFHTLYAHGHPVVLLVIGQQPEAVYDYTKGWKDSDIGQRLIVTGYCSESDVSRYLQCGDILLAPFLDGVSTRRGSVMAALHHALPVVTTAGPATDRAVFAGAVSLMARGDDDGYVAAVEALVSDAAARHCLGQQGQELSKRLFSWPSIAEQLLRLATGDSVSRAIDPSSNGDIHTVMG